MAHLVIEKIAFVLATIATMACILQINGRVPWTDHDFSMFSYSMKMAIVFTVFIASMLIPLRRQKSTAGVSRIQDPVIEKSLVVLAITTSVCWILMINGNIPWKAESSSLLTYCSKLAILVFTVSTLSSYLVRTMKHEKPTTVYSSMEDHLNALLLCAVTTTTWILKIDAYVPWKENDYSVFTFCCKVGILLMASTLSIIWACARTCPKPSAAVSPVCQM